MEKNENIHLTLNDLKKFVKVEEKICEDFRDKYYNCMNKNEKDFNKCIKFYDIALKCFFLYDNQTKNK